MWALYVCVYVRVSVCGDLHRTSHGILFVFGYIHLSSYGAVVSCWFDSGCARVYVSVAARRFCMIVVSRAHASLLQEDVKLKVLHHLNTSSLHWATFAGGADMEALAASCEVWEEEPLASIVLITSCMAVVRCF
jgi:hypothetical protein